MQLFCRIFIEVHQKQYFASQWHMKILMVVMSDCFKLRNLMLGIILDLNLRAEFSILNKRFYFICLSCQYIMPKKVKTHTFILDLKSRQVILTLKQSFFKLTL